MNDDDELRRRLHDIPAPSVRLDADAVLADAKRRRRPKTIALSSAATVAGVLLFAPLVAPGIEALRPSSGVSVDAGAAPTEAGAGEAGSSDGSTDENTAGAEEAPLCGLPRAGDVGLVLTFAERPAGATPVQVRAVGEGDARVTAVAIESLTITDAAARVEPGISREELVLAAGDTAALTVVTATLAPGACGDGVPASATPVAIVGVDGAEPVAVAGSPWQ